MSRYTSLFEDAAKVIEATPQFPGQSIPGLWEMTDKTTWPMLIGVIMGNAIATVCLKRSDCIFEHALERLVEVTAGSEVELKGDPAQIAASRLRYAAQINATRVETAVDRLIRLAGYAADTFDRLAQSHYPLKERENLLGLVKEIRGAVGDAKIVGTENATQG